MSATDEILKQMRDLADEVRIHGAGRFRKNTETPEVLSESSVWRQLQPRSNRFRCRNSFGPALGEPTPETEVTFLEFADTNPFKIEGNLKELEKERKQKAYFNSLNGDLNKKMEYVDLCFKNQVWFYGDGRICHIKIMKDSHLVNTISYIERKLKEGTNPIWRKGKDWMPILIKETERRLEEQEIPF